MIVGILGGIVLLIVVIIGGALWMTNASAKVATDFMNSIISHNITHAYELVSPELKEGKDEASFEEFVQGDSVFSKANHYEISGREVQNNVAQITGIVSTSDAQTYDISIVLEKSSGNWLVSGWDIR